MPPKVSIGLPVRNGGDLLSLAIQSILAQDFGDIELLISDNASDDATPDTCADYARIDRRIKIVRHDRAITGIRNFEFVLDNTTREMFMWAAHDDSRMPDCISRHVASSNPIDRLRFILRQNAWGAIYGLFRRDALSRCRRLSSIYRLPNGISIDYSLIELALMGSFVYIPESLTVCAVRAFDPSAIAAKIDAQDINRAVLWWLVTDLWKMSGLHHLTIQNRLTAICEVLETALHSGIMNQYLRRLNGNAIKTATRDMDLPSLFSLWLEWTALRARSTK